MNIDIENNSIEKQPFWIPIYKVIKNSYFEEKTIFPTKN